MSFVGQRKHALCKISKSWNGARGKFSVVAAAKIGTRRRRNWTSKPNIISESGNQDIRIRQMSQSEQMRGANDELEQITQRKNNQILKKGTPLFPSDIKGTQQVITRLKCSSLPPFSVSVIKDMSELGEESQPGYSLLMGDRETFGPNKDMI